MRRALAVVLVAAACGGSDLAPSASVHAQINTPFSLEIGQSAVLDEPAVVVTLTAVVEDSRCPVDVVCIWQGDAVVRLTLHPGPPDSDGPDVLADLHLNREPRSTPWGVYYELRFLALAPEARLHPLPTEPYRATLVMESR